MSVLLSRRGQSTNFIRIPWSATYNQKKWKTRNHEYTQYAKDAAINGDDLPVLAKPHNNVLFSERRIQWTMDAEIRG